MQCPNRPSSRQQWAGTVHPCSSFSYNTPDLEATPFSSPNTQVHILGWGSPWPVSLSPLGSLGFPSRPFPTSFQQYSFQGQLGRKELSYSSDDSKALCGKCALLKGVCENHEGVVSFHSPLPSSVPSFCSTYPLRRGWDSSGCSQGKKNK